MHWIYLLRDPRTHAIRYVGCAVDVERRFGYHMSTARRGDRCPKARWLRRLIARRLEPTIEVAEYLGTRVDHVLRERQWIEHLLALGEKLLNVENGGVAPRSRPKRIPEGERARRAMVVGAGVRRAVAEYGDRSLPPAAAPPEDVPAPSRLNRFGHFQDALGRWRTPRGAKPRGRVPVKRPLR